MKSSTFFLAFLFVFSGLLFSGCSKVRPSNMPPLAPCKIKVHDGGSPRANIAVFFQRVEGQGGWSLNGQTGADGIAIAQTVAGAFEAKGIPHGTYRITLGERIELPPELSGGVDPGMSEQQRREIMDKVEKFFAENRTLPAILCDASKSPLEISVTASGAELDVDISKYK